jgi:hypothetical protein
VTRPFLSSAVALVLVLTLAASGSAHDPTGLVERLGALPGELIKAKKSDGEIAEALHLATLVRLPTDEQKELAVKHLAAAKDKRLACQDLAWALINSKEFLKLHGMDQNLAESLQFLNTITQKWDKHKKEEQKQK